MARDPYRGCEEIASTITNSFVVFLVSLVYLVCLIFLVEQDQLNEQNKSDEPDTPEQTAGSHTSRAAIQ